MKKSFDRISRMYAEFVNEHDKAVKGNKSAAMRARKLSTALTKELKAYRTASLDETRKG